MMNNDRPFVSARRVAHAATVAVAFQNHFSEATEMLLTLSLERIADSAQTVGEDPQISAAAMHRALFEPCHFPPLPRYR